jgi:hypothetical protein
LIVGMLFSIPVANMKLAMIQSPSGVAVADSVRFAARVPG